MTKVRRRPPSHRPANHDIFTQQCLCLPQLHFDSPCPLSDIGGADSPCVGGSSASQRPSLRPFFILSSSFPRFLSGFLKLIDRPCPLFILPVPEKMQSIHTDVLQGPPAGNGWGRIRDAHAPASAGDLHPVHFGYVPMVISPLQFVLRQNKLGCGAVHPDNYLEKRRVKKNGK